MRSGHSVYLGDNTMPDTGLSTGLSIGGETISYSGSVKFSTQVQDCGTRGRRPGRTTSGVSGGVCVRLLLR